MIKKKTNCFLKYESTQLKDGVLIIPMMQIDYEKITHIFRCLKINSL